MNWEAFCCCHSSKYSLILQHFCLGSVYLQSQLLNFPCSNGSNAWNNVSSSTYHQQKCSQNLDPPHSFLSKLLHRQCSQVFTASSWCSKLTSCGRCHFEDSSTEKGSSGHFRAEFSSLFPDLYLLSLFLFNTAIKQKLELVPQYLFLFTGNLSSLFLIPFISNFINTIINYILLSRIMNLLKNFGGGGSSMASMGASKPLGTKNNYFSTLKLQQDQPAGKQKSKDQKKGDKKKGPPKDFIPNKFALSFDPPSIIFQYKNPENNKLYHHKMRLKKLKKDTNTKDALDFLRKKHNQYFAPKVIDEAQIEKLIEKLKMGLAENRESQMQDVQEEDDFDFDYDDDFEDL